MGQINLKEFALEIERLLEELGLDPVVYDNPHDAFEPILEFRDKPISDEAWRDSVVVFLRDLTGFHFDVATGLWSDSYAGRHVCRTLRVDTNGTLGEVGVGMADGDGSVEEWFPITSPTEVIEVMKLLGSKSAFAGRRAKSSPVVQPSSLIEDVYVPFFPFYPEPQKDWGKQVWVKLAVVKDLITDHINQSLRWIEIPFTAVKKQVAAAKFGGSSSASIFHEVFGDPDRFAEGAELGLVADGLLKLHTKLSDDQRAMYVDISGKLKSRDVLTPAEMSQCMTSTVPYAQDADASQLPKLLPVKVKLNKFSYPPFFAQGVNPEGHAALMANVGAMVTGTSSEKNGAELELPKLSEQQEAVFVSRRYQHELLRLGRQLGKFGGTRDGDADVDVQLKRKRLRYLSVSKMLDSVADDESELRRALHPLPFFLEVPLIRWERSHEKLNHHSAVACLQQVLKMFSLLGLEELQSVQGEIEGFVQMDDALLKGLSSKPSLGHWFGCAEFLAKNARHLPIWGDCLKLIGSERRRINDLIERRNRIAHPDYVLDLGFLASVEGAFKQFFNDFFDTLRGIFQSMDLLLPMSRTGTRDADNKVSYRFNCLDLKTSVEPFPQLVRELSEADSRNVMEGTVLVNRRGRTLPLSHFFKVEEIEGTPEIFVYDRDFVDGAAQVVGLTTGASQRASLPAWSFSFFQT